MVPKRMTPKFEIVLLFENSASEKGRGERDSCSVSLWSSYSEEGFQLAEPLPTQMGDWNVLLLFFCEKKKKKKKKKKRKKKKKKKKKK